MESQAKPTSEKNRAGFALAGLAALIAWGADSAQAREGESEVAAPVPCALITQVAGQVDVLDSTRTHLLDSSRGAPIPCGGWISAGKGSVELKHRDGFELHVGSGSFVQLQEPNTDGNYSGDHAILFRGQLFAQAGGGSGELRVLTANARTRVRRGSAVVVYSHEDEETQLIALDSSSSLENRFEPSRKVIAKPGEATSLNFKQLRVVPGTPRAVALAALRDKFEDLRVPERDRQAAIHAAHQRQERIFATALVDADESGASRSVASAPADVAKDVKERLLKARGREPASSGNYSSHADDEQARVVKRAWVNRLVAGQSEGADKIVSPHESENSGARNPSGGEGAEDVRGAHVKARRLTVEDEEKLKLIDELSRLHED